MSLLRRLTGKPQPAAPVPAAPDPLARFHGLPEKLLRDFEILAHEQGLLGTIQSNLPIDPSGAPIPWYTYPAIEYLRQFDLTAKAVFEFGCGNSSLFWSGLGALVWSVDHDEGWHAKMAQAAGPRQIFYLGTERDTYIGAIEKPGRNFDIVVIDGAWREDCVDPAIRHLAPGGMIVLDNADRDHEAGRLLRARDFFEIDFNGFGPINDYTWTTALFLPPAGTQLRISRPPLPVGGHPNNRGGA